MNKAVEKKTVEFIAKMLFSAGITPRMMPKNGSFQKVLLYHNPDPAVFSEHLSFLKQHFGMISLEEAVKKEKNGIALTFDDSYRGVAEKIFPILEKQGVPATVFVPVGYCGRIYQLEALKIALQKSKLKKIFFQETGLLEIDGAEKAKNAWHLLVEKLVLLQPEERDNRITAIIQSLKVDKNALSAAMITDKAALEKKPVQVLLASHSMMHPNLAVLDKVACLRELEQSKKKVEEITGKKCIFFAYPFGEREHFSSEIAEQVRQAGYGFAFIAVPETIPELGSFGIGRIGIGDTDSVALLCLKLSGIWRLLRAAK